MNKFIYQTIAVLLTAVLLLPMLVLPGAAAGGAQPLLPETETLMKENAAAAAQTVLNSRSILTHSKTRVLGKTYTGTAYYLAENGNDDADGLTKDTAWKTLEKLERELSGQGTSAIQKGDAVFFRRGDTFVIPDTGLSSWISGMTFSAFGEGAKPVIAGARSADAAKWSAAWEQDGVRIWQYADPVSDIYMIAGDSRTAQGIAADAQNAAPEQVLLRDMTFCTKGTSLYLRCDGGAPDQVLGSVYLVGGSTAAFGIHGDNTVVDNLSFRYSARVESEPSVDGVLIQNCEFGFGSSVAGVVRNSEIRSSYFHDSREPAFTADTVNYSRTIDGSLAFRSNVVMNTAGLVLAISERDILSALRITGNQIWNTGTWTESGCTGALFITPGRYEELLIESNVFCATKNSGQENALLDLGMWRFAEARMTAPSLRSNVYAQYPGGSFAFFGMEENTVWTMDTNMLTDIAASRLADRESEFYLLTATDHVHSFAAEAAESASCVMGALTELTCTQCGQKELLPTAAPGHDYQSGSCTRCGAQEPVPAPAYIPESPSGLPVESTQGVLVEEPDGSFAWYVNGLWESGKYGFVEYQGGKFLVAHGMLASDANGLTQDPENAGDWYYLASGQVQLEYTGLVQFDASWFYVENGKMSNDLTGIVEYDGSLFLVVNGQVVTYRDSLAQDPESGVTYYFIQGQVQREFSGLVKQDGRWYYIQNGIFMEHYNGALEYSGRTFLIRDGIMRAIVK